MVAQGAREVRESISDRPGGWWERTFSVPSSSSKRPLAPMAMLTVLHPVTCPCSLATNSRERIEYSRGSVPNLCAASS